MTDASTAQQAALLALSKRLGYTFNNLSLLALALTHNSASQVVADSSNNNSNSAMPRLINNQRLEFFGDAVLGLFVAEALYNKYPQADQGELTQMRANIVNAKALANVAKSINVSEALQLGTAQASLAHNDNVLADAMEAIIAAIFVDGGWPAAFNVLSQLLSAHLQQTWSATTPATKDDKSVLQEITQQHKWPRPIYKVLSQDGPAHQPHFTVELLLPTTYEPSDDINEPDNNKSSQKDGRADEKSCILTTLGEGASRREAEKQAAKRAIELLKVIAP